MSGQCMLSFEYCWDIVEGKRTLYGPCMTTGTFPKSQEASRGQSFAPASSPLECLGHSRLPFQAGEAWEHRCRHLRRAVCLPCPYEDPL